MDMETLDLKKFAERLKESREGRKLSQLELSFESHISQGAISEYENGTRSPTGDKLKRLAKALYVTTDYLLGMDTDPDAAPPEPEPQNPIRDEVLDDENFWKSRGIFPPSEEEKKYLRQNFSFRITFKNMDELKKGYQDIYIYLLQREREMKNR